MIFKNRYQAEKEKKNNPFLNATYKIIKVCGGYKIMSELEYKVWKNQK